MPRTNIFLAISIVIFVILLAACTTNSSNSTTSMKNDPADVLSSGNNFDSEYTPYENSEYDIAFYYPAGLVLRDYDPLGDLLYSLDFTRPDMLEHIEYQVPSVSLAVLANSKMESLDQWLISRSYEDYEQIPWDLEVGSPYYISITELGQFELDGHDAALFRHNVMGTTFATLLVASGEEVISISYQDYEDLIEDFLIMASSLQVSINIDDLSIDSDLRGNIRELLRDL